MEEVDILMATYNTKIEYLKKQIESILSQTYKEINLLISDDCSPNKEVEKTLEEYAKRDKRIKLYKTEHNLGYTKNFEYLLQKSTSKYICFSDHDDIWYPEKIEKSLEKLAELMDKGVSDIEMAKEKVRKYAKYIGCTNENIFTTRIDAIYTFENA